MMFVIRYNENMSKEKNILSPGQPSIEKRYHEETTRMTFTLPVSFHQWLSSQDVAAAEYLRRLIAADKAQKSK